MDTSTTIVGTSEINDSAVTTAKIADSAVTAAKIPNSEIPNAKRVQAPGGNSANYNGLACAFGATVTLGSVTWTATGGRRTTYAMEARWWTGSDGARITSTSSANEIYLRIKLDGTTTISQVKLTGQTLYLPPLLAGNSLPTAGSHTATLEIEHAAGSGSASAYHLTLLVIEH